MTAALKSYVPRPTPTRVRAASPSSEPSHQLRGTSSRAARTQGGHVQPLPLSAEPSPLLVTLGRLQLVASVLTTTLVGLSLVSYGASVYVDRQLSQATQQLSKLQRSEQQLTTANAILSSHMAQQAELPATGLQPPKPDSVIFLKPATPRPAPPPSANPTSPESEIQRPLGY